MSAFYPPLPEKTDWALKVIMANLEEDPDYLKSLDCPYPQDVIDILDRNTRETGEDIDLVIELEQVYRELRDRKNKLGKDDHAEAMAYFRTATQLMEKLLGLQEKAVGLRQMQQFQRVVLGAMEDLMDADAREELTKRLKEIGA